MADDRSLRRPLRDQRRRGRIEEQLPCAVGGNGAYDKLDSPCKSASIRSRAVTRSGPSFQLRLCLVGVATWGKQRRPESHDDRRIPSLGPVDESFDAVKGGRRRGISKLWPLANGP